MGWHYVNLIDTCIYTSDMLDFEKGAGTIVWDGRDDDGKLAPAGDYTYYLWGYDSQSPRILVNRLYGPRSNSAGNIVTVDSNNLPLANPIFYPAAEAIPQLAVANGGYDAATQNTGTKIRAKWTIGNDPMDSSTVETTAYAGWRDSGKIAFMPGDHRYFFVQNNIAKAVVSGGLQHVMKLKWTPNGMSEQVTDFGENGSFSVANTSAGYAGPISDNVSSLWAVIGDNSYPDVANPAAMYYLDPSDGSLLRTYDFHWLWWDQLEMERAAAQSDKYHGGPTEANFANGRIYCAGLSFCMKHCIDPYKELDEDVTLWYNGNGDYIGDRFFDESAGNKAWYCSASSGAPWVYDFTADNNGFAMFSTYDLGAVTFGLLGPDGTGIANLALPGETAGFHYGQIVVDYDSPFDGIYCDNHPDSSYPMAQWYVAHDSIKGIITTQIGVDNYTPAAFTVAQNSPNPFNPTTTISFTLAKAGKTTVEVYNVAGQKIDTLVNGNLSAGNHTATWNATKFSAGVYFYTVKNGSFSKTMKMTLLK